MTENKFKKVLNNYIDLIVFWYDHDNEVWNGMGYTSSSIEMIVKKRLGCPIYYAYYSIKKSNQKYFKFLEKYSTPPQETPKEKYFEVIQQLNDILCEIKERTELIFASELSKATSPPKPFMELWDKKIEENASLP